MKGHEEQNLEVGMEVSHEGGVEKRKGVVRFWNADTGRWMQLTLNQEAMATFAAAAQQISDRMLQVDPRVIPATVIPSEMRVH